MAYTYLGSTKTRATSSAVDTTGATLIVAVIGSSSGAGAPTDSQTNSWTVLTQSGPGSNSGKALICYVKTPTTSASHTFTTSASFPAMCVAWFSGSSTTVDPFTHEAQTSGNSPLGSSVTTTNDGELIIAGLSEPGTGESINNGTIVQSDPFAGGVTYGANIAYYIQPTQGSITETFTYTGGGCGFTMASFKPSAGASTPSMSTWFRGVSQPVLSPTDIVSV